MKTNHNDAAGNRPPVLAGAVPSVLRAFLASEATGGILLMAAAAVALLIVNLSPGGADAYHHLLEMRTGPVLAPALGPMTVHMWINDGLMALFFLLVGLEIKREWVDGRLTGWRSRRLPFVAAVAGMVLPAAIYLLLSRDAPALARGWAIPAATDIAFALGVLALLGERVPISLKLLLTTIAIVDDMGAVIIIAIAYTAALDFMPLAAAGAVLLTMFAMNRLGVRMIAFYLLGFLLLWYCILLSGVHATVAGVLAALAVPIRATPGAPDAEDSTLHRLEHGLHPWSAFLIVPLFGFANAGVALPPDLAGALLAPLPLGIAAGLFIGKQAGIFGAIRLAVALRIATVPVGATWLQVYGMTILCGVGFTMSLFIGGLAFAGQEPLLDEVRIGVLTGSLLSAVAGLAVLALA
ncbi:MAG TPA: Na+/H+ antiporter NhaA, partial [Sphingobium sp.]|nr:Na+/H+ antiporter NhaA [Sphingobium sp.]